MAKIGSMSINAGELGVGVVFSWREDTFKVVGHVADDFDLYVVQKQVDGSWSEEQRFNGYCSVEVSGVQV